jgi:HEAT repeat protein
MPELFEVLASGSVAEKLKAIGETMSLDELSDPRIARAVVRALADEEAPVRRRALEAISLLTHRGLWKLDPEVLERGLALADDPDASVRAEAAVALALLPYGDLQVILQKLLTLLEDPAPVVRREAAAALGDMGDQKVIPDLARHLEDQDEPTRFEAAFALATLKDERSLPHLLPELDRSSRRFDACEALKRLGSPAAVPELWRASKRLLVGWPERLTIWATLYALGEKSAAEQILARAKSRSREERALALALVGSHKVEEGRALLESVANDERDPLHETARGALEGWS